MPGRAKNRAEWMTKAKSREPDIDRPIVLVGLMGAGKSCIGRRLAQRLHLPFVDADSEIEKAAGCTIEEIFQRHGEAEFRSGERRVIQRLLRGGGRIIATGGGAYMDGETRAAINDQAHCLWLRADIEILLSRTARRDNRPLLKQGDPRQILERLIGERYPVYGEAAIVVDSQDGPPEQTVDRVMEALVDHLDGAARSGTAKSARGSDPSGVPSRAADTGSVPS